MARAPALFKWYLGDIVGSVRQVVKADGTVLDNITYDSFGKILSETVRTINWTYDDAGRLISASDPDSSYAYQYDVADQLIQVDNQGTPGVPRMLLSFGYDFAGNRTYVGDNLGGKIYSTHSGEGLVTGLTLAVGPPGEESPVARVDLSYDDAARLTGLTRTASAAGSATLSTAFLYDAADRLTSITHTNDDTQTTLLQFSYTFDAANQIASYTGPEGTLNYQYDNTGQLLHVTGARAEDYSFDVNGNRSMPGYQTGSGNRLLSDGTNNYEYDNEGNTTAKVRISDGQRTENTWDYRNRRTRTVLKNASGTVLKEQRNTYDVDNRRIGVWEDDNGDGVGTQRWTVYDGVNPYADFDASGSLTTRYLYGPAIDQLFGRWSATGGEVDWYLGDIVGSVRQIVKTDGTVLDNITYDSFGKILSESNPTNGDRFKYTGREWDAVFEEYYYRARFYNQDIGRFTGQDPLGFGGGDSNLYRYVGNHGQMARDPEGLSEFWDLNGNPILRDPVPAPSDGPFIPPPFNAAAGIYVIYLAEQTIEKTPFGGGVPFTSELSVGLDKIAERLPSWLQELPFRVPTPITDRAGRLALRWTCTVARVAARWLPVVGWALIIWDGVQIVSAVVSEVSSAVNDRGNMPPEPVLTLGGDQPRIVGDDRPFKGIRK